VYRLRSPGFKNPCSRLKTVFFSLSQSASNATGVFRRAITRRQLVGEMTVIVFMCPIRNDGER
jgi:hypothetical protein